MIMIVIMENLNRHRGSKRRELAHTRGSHAFIHALTFNTVATTWCEAPVQLLQNFESNFYFILKVHDVGVHPVVSSPEPEQDDLLVCSV